MTEATRDEHLLFTDRHAVAWRIGPGDRVRLLHYGEAEDLRSAPTWLRRPATLREAIRAILPRDGDADPLRPSPTPTPTDPPGITQERLGSADLELLGLGIDLRRMTLAPGAALPPTHFDEGWLVRLEDGELEIAVTQGRAVISGDASPDGRWLEAGDTGTLFAGDRVVVDGRSIVSWRALGTVPAVVLMSGVVRSPEAALAAVTDEPTTEDLFDGDVIRRFVLTGPGATEGRSRITVADRSGRVIGARVPTERDLRFAGGGDPPVHHQGHPDLRIGPVAWLEDPVRELLVRWTGTPCGPVVTVDVARELAAIRIIDRTPGCDAAAMGHSVVLRFRGDPPDPADIHGSWVRRR
jgi:hypothetical protein